MTESPNPKTSRAICSFWSLVVAALLLSACGGEVSSPTISTAEAEGATTLIAALGDSITAGSPLWDPNEAVRAQIGSSLDERSQFEYWATKADPSLEFSNCGVFGERTDEIALRLDDCAEGADALIIQGGINDIAQGIPVKRAAENLRSMVQSGKELGLPVALIDVLPWNNGHPSADAPIEQLNELIGEIGRDEDVPVLPFHDTLESSAQPGVMAGALTDDGNHPSVEGYKLLAEKALDELPLP